MMNGSDTKGQYQISACRLGPHYVSQWPLHRVTTPPFEGKVFRAVCSEVSEKCGCVSILSFASASAIATLATDFPKRQLIDGMILHASS